MKNDNKKEKNARHYDIGSILVTLLLYAIFGTVYGVLLWGWIKTCDQVHGEYKAIESGVIVDAELNDIYSTVDRSSNGMKVRYDVIYEYIDGDIRYHGIAVYEVNEYYEAEKYLGKKIKIYIDGKGHSLPVGSKPKLLTVTIATVFVVVLFYPMLFWPLLLKQISKRQKKRQAKREQGNCQGSMFFPYIKPNDNDNKK